MANQQALTLEAIMSIKKAVARDRDRIPDSDNEAPKITNRGNKLKRRAEYYHEGEMGGRMPFKRKIDHAGYSRYILRRNPRRFDEEGFELLTDEEDAEADYEASEKNPYTGIRIEELLMPLTRPSDLQHHPTMSQPYNTKTLENMVRETLELVHRERRTLVDLMLLMEQLRGDAPWIPAGAMMQTDDIALFGTEKRHDGTYAAPKLYPFEDRDLLASGLAPDAEFPADDIAEPRVNGDEDEDFQPKVKHEDENLLPMAGKGYPNGTSLHVASDGNSKPANVLPKEEETAIDDALNANANSTETHEQSGAFEANGDESSHKINGVTAETTGSSKESTENEPGQQPNIDVEQNVEVSKSSNPPTPSAISTPGSSPPARMQTRAQTNAANGTPQLTNLSRSASPVPARPASPLTLHPIYLTLPTALPDRNIGLPPPEAEELRRLLAVYIQKQEEVCRGADRLYQGLLKAVRLRDTVWWWCRAEEHRGQMSDGEDWVDLDEWGLEEGLRKGDAVTEENVEEPGKKTRGRRAAA